MSSEPSSVQNLIALLGGAGILALVAHFMGPYKEESLYSQLNLALKENNASLQTDIARLTHTVSALQFTNERLVAEKDKLVEQIERLKQVAGDFSESTEASKEISEKVESLIQRLAAFEELKTENEQLKLALEESTQNVIELTAMLERTNVSAQVPKEIKC